MYYKTIQSSEITMIGESSVVPQNAVEISEEKYDQIMAVIQTHPEDTLETKHYLSAETETYVGRETTHDEKVDWYVSAVVTNQMTIDGVPIEYQEEVKAKLPSEPASEDVDQVLSELEIEVGINEQ
jgi:hypothetical protein|nr:MAG TPA: hypothetical protein [Caudoviricetes sp.]